MTMRPVYYDFVPSDEDTDGIVVGLTGAGPWLAASFIRSGPPDGLAHQISLVSTANLSGINITITGLDADGVEFSETRAGPNNNTVETSQYFKEIISISAASTLGANTLDVGWVDEFVSQTIPLETILHNPVSAQVTLTGTANFDIEDTLSDIRGSYSPPLAQNTFTWLNDGNFTAKTATLAAELAIAGIRGIRLAVNSYTNGALFNLAIVTPSP